jgi:hypothetical protein
MAAHAVGRRRCATLDKSQQRLLFLHIVSFPECREVYRAETRLRAPEDPSGPSLPLTF